MTNNAIASDYTTIGNKTTLIVIHPDNELFVSDGDFNIVDVVAATSDGYINVDFEKPNSFKISRAYPNPFNPSTSFDINVVNTGYVSVSVYDLNEITGKLYIASEIGIYQYNHLSLK